MTPLENLGTRVKAERRRLYRTVDNARAVAKISRGAWDNVEHGRPVKEQTYYAVEVALKWPVGTCQSIIDGDTPPTAASDEIEALRTELRRIAAELDRLENNSGAVDKSTPKGA